MSLPRIVEAGLRSSVAAYPEYTGEPFALGQLVAIREGRWTTYAVVADAASGPEDPSRPLQAQPGGGSAADLFAEHPHIRPLLRTRLTLVSCAHAERGRVVAGPPPAPPLLLAAVEGCDDQEVALVTGDGGFLAPLVASPLCDDAVLTSALRVAAQGAADRRAFVVHAGKELARLLRAEPARLTTILRGAI
ncbi:MAG: hypothetical protein ACKVVT_18325 [Dehalococcoidia bacterium]